MLSYNHSSSAELVRALKQQLNAAGLKTWIDEENLPPGSLIDGMELAITNAGLVLVCYSDGYKRSANCRMEAEYALQQRKQLLFVRAERSYRPDGWLAFLLGQNLYYDLAGKPEVALRLVEHVQLLFQGRPSGHLPPLTSPSPSQSTSAKAVRAEGAQKSSAGGASAKKQERPYFKWTGQEVLNWLQTKELDFLLNLYTFSFICVFEYFNPL